MDTRLSIAVQKNGRLSEKSLELIKSCGIDFYADSRVLKASASGFPLDFLFVRDDDIPQYVADGVADIGIVGRNEYDESVSTMSLVLISMLSGNLRLHRAGCLSLFRKASGIRV